MPELPEVKTVSKDLCNLFCNKKISYVELFLTKALKNFDKDSLKNIKEENIDNIYQHGKNLIIKTTNYFFILHLRMEGKFQIINSVDEINKNFIVMLFYFQKNILAFLDHRKFATVNIFKNNQTKEIKKYFEKYGPEPWDVDIKKLYEEVKNKRIAIKTTLLDQKYMSGIGNIYADEILYASKIHPKTPTNKVNFEVISEIVNNAILILNHATELKGTTIKTFHSVGDKGMYQNELNVHSLKGKNCKSCGSEIIKTKINGRGTYYCPLEQKLL